MPLSATDAGFMHVKQLRKRLLPIELRESEAHDDQLIAIGRRVLAHFERHTGRLFSRVQADDEWITSADNQTLVVPRYPIEGTPVVQFKSSDGDSWESVEIDATIPQAGIIHLFGEPGGSRDLVKVTYGGGYWHDDSEEADTAIGDVEVEEGATVTAAPDALVECWVLQVDHECRERQIIGGEGSVAVMPSSAIDGRFKTSRGPERIELRGVVKAVLDGYRRFF